MRTARAKIPVSIIVITEPMTIAGKDFQAGDLMFSDGLRMWGTPLKDVPTTGYLFGKDIPGLLDEAHKLAGEK